jgi:hypothetical protein
MKNTAIQEEWKRKTPTVKVGNETFSEIPKEAVLVSKWLTNVWIDLGRPKTPFTESGQKLMDVIIAAWEDLYPIQVEDWKKSRSDYQLNELSISEQVHRKTGRTLASFPLPIFQMMKRIFPDFKIGERKNTISLAKRWPMFRMANKI